MPYGAQTSLAVEWMIGLLFYKWCVPVAGRETENVHFEYTCEEKKKRTGAG